MRTNFTTTLTSKYQITLPKSVQMKLGVKIGAKFNIYPTRDGFEAILKRPSRIMDFVGDLKQFDDGKRVEDIREEAQARSAGELTSSDPS